MTPPLNRSWAPDYVVRWLFDQDEFWITAKGDKVLISKMGDGHAVNTLLMLERVAGDIEPLLTSAVVSPLVSIQDTALYTALYRKVMAAVGEGFPPLAEPEIEPWDTDVSAEQPKPRTEAWEADAAGEAGGLGDLIGQLFRGPTAKSGRITSVKPNGEATLEYPWLYDRAQIRELLSNSIGVDYDVFVDYVDRDGNETDDRRVKVTALRTLQSITNPFPEIRVLLVDRDDDDEVKSFYLSRIRRARRA